MHPHWWERQVRTKARALQREALEQRRHRWALVAVDAVGGGDTSTAGWLERISGLNPTMLLLALLVMLSSAGFGVLLPFVPLYAEDLGARPVEIGLMVSAFAVGSGLGNLVAGRVTDQVGRKSSLVAGMVLFAVATLLLALVADPTLFIACRVLEGLGFGFIYPSANALAQDLAPAERLGQSLGAFSTVTLLGSFVGPAAGGLLAGLVGYQGTFVVVAILALMGALLAGLMLTEAASEKSQVDESEQEQPPVPARLRLNTLLLAAYVTGGAVFLNNGMMQVAEALYFANEFNASPQLVGLLFSLISLGTLLARYPAGLVVDRLGVPPVLVTGLVVSGLVSIALPFAGSLLGAALFGTLAAFFGVVAASTIHVLVAKGAPKEVRGRANSVLGLLSSLGLLTGAPTGTRLYDLWPGGAFVASGAGFIVAALVNVLLLSIRMPGGQPRQSSSGSW